MELLYLIGQQTSLIRTPLGINGTLYTFFNCLQIHNTFLVTEILYMHTKYMYVFEPLLEITQFLQPDIP